MNLPDIKTIKRTQSDISSYIIKTPTLINTGPIISDILGQSVYLKMELFQRTGTFKFRGAINNLIKTDITGKGITAVSAGNHAVAVACAASVLKIDAKVVMISTANPARRFLAESYGAKIVYKDSGEEAFKEANRLVSQENRVMIHPFDGINVAAATGTIGLELEQDNLDVVIVATGGGGLLGGIAAAVKQINPNCKVFGVEPLHAQGMALSIAAGKALNDFEVDTIADSLAPPLTTDYTVSICQKFVDDMVQVTDDEICRALYIMFHDNKLVVEPAGATALAGALGPLKNQVKEKRVGIIICGSCIDADSYKKLLKRGGDLYND